MLFTLYIDFAFIMSQAPKFRPHKEINPLTRQQRRIDIGTRISFVLPGYAGRSNVSNAWCFRAGRVVNIVCSSSKSIEPSGCNVRLDTLLTPSQAAKAPCTYQWAPDKSDEPSDQRYVFVRFEDVVADHVPEGKDALNTPPMTFGPGARLMVYHGTAMDYPVRCTVVGLVHRQRHAKIKYSRTYQVASQDPAWPKQAFRTRYVTKHRVPVYSLPVFSVVEGCPNHHEMHVSLPNRVSSCTLLSRLKYMWRDFEFHQVHNVVTKTASRSLDGTYKRDAYGTALIRARVSNNNTVHLAPAMVNTLPETVSTQELNTSLHTSPPLKNNTKDSDTAPQNTPHPMSVQKEDPYNVYRFYHGFTEPPTQDEENGIYFDTRMYGELDINTECTMRLVRRAKMAYPRIEVGQWIMGIRGENKNGPYLRVWTPVSDQLKAFVRGVQQGTLPAPELLQCNVALSKQVAFIMGDQASNCDTKEARLNDYLEHDVGMPRTERLSLPPFQYVYSDLARLGRHCEENAPYPSVSPNAIRELPQCASHLVTSVMWCCRTF